MWGGGWVILLSYCTNLFESTESVSTYKGVSWNKQKKQWEAKFYFKGYIFKSKFGFKHELDAATRIRQFCTMMEIPQQNPRVSKILRQNVIQSFFNQMLFVFKSQLFKTTAYL